MTDSLEAQLQAFMQRHRSKSGQVDGCHRLTGGATMESWGFDFGGESFVLRRAPSLEFMTDRPFGHATEAAIIRAAHAAGVTAPEVVAVLEPTDGLGSGFVMQALPGTPDPRQILAMDDTSRILAQAGKNLARIHALKSTSLPRDVPVMDYRDALEKLKAQFKEAGADRPIIALGLKWLEDNLPAPVAPVLNHGDFRLGNLLAQDSQLTGVLDWELAHFGDRHEDLAFGCMTVWRFARIDRPAMGLGPLKDYFAAYEAECGAVVDHGRFRFWLIYRTVWWALGCLQMAKFWRGGEDRMLERVVISRRTSEQELDLLMLLEEDAPEDERAKTFTLKLDDMHTGKGEATVSEILLAVSEWLATVKNDMRGHDKFQLAVARNALGMCIREEAQLPGMFESSVYARKIASGEVTLQMPGTLRTLRRSALEKLSVDVPKYPALAVARKKWTGED